MFEIITIFTVKFLLPFIGSSLLFLALLLINEGMKSFRKKAAYKKWEKEYLKGDK